MTLEEENAILKEANRELAVALQLASPGGNTIESQAASFINEAIDLIAEHKKLKSHVEKLVEIFEADGMAPCNDGCALGGILAWVDPADFERVRELRDKLREENEVLKEANAHVAQNEKLLEISVALNELHTKVSNGTSEMIAKLRADSEMMAKLRAAIADASRAYVERGMLMCGICDHPVEVCDDISEASGFDPLLDKPCPGRVLRAALAAS